MIIYHLYKNSLEKDQTNGQKRQKSHFLNKWKHVRDMSGVLASSSLVLGELTRDQITCLGSNMRGGDFNSREGCAFVDVAFGCWLGVDPKEEGHTS